MIYDMETEQHVLGGLIKFPKTYFRICDKLKSFHFHFSHHQDIYLLLSQIIEANPEREKVELITLGQRIEGAGIKHGKLKVKDYVQEIACTPVTKEGLIDVIKQLIRTYSLRKGAGSCVEALEYLKSSETRNLPAREIQTKVNSHCSEISSLFIDEDEEQPKLLCEGARERLEQAAENANNGIWYGFDTHLPSLNSLYGGILPGEMLVVSTITGGGKSTFLSSLALNICINQNIPVLHLDTEMDPDVSCDRVISSLSGVGYSYLRRGQWGMNNEMVDKVYDLLNKYDPLEDSDGNKKKNALPYYSKYVGHCDLEEVMAMVRSFAAKNIEEGQPWIFIYDYLQLTQGDKTSGHWAEWQIVADKATKFHNLAKELNAAFLTAIQSNKEGDPFSKNSNAGALSSIGTSYKAIQNSNQTFLLLPKTPTDLAEDEGLSIDEAMDISVELRHGDSQAARSQLNWGNYKLSCKKCRHGGPNYPGITDPVARRKLNGNIEIDQNYICLDIDNFKVQEEGTLRELAERQNTGQDNRHQASDDTDRVNELEEIL